MCLHLREPALEPRHRLLQQVSGSGAGRGPVQPGPPRSRQEHKVGLWWPHWRVLKGDPAHLSSIPSGMGRSLVTFQCHPHGLKDFLVCKYLWVSLFTPVSQGLSFAEAVSTRCQSTSQRPRRGLCVAPCFLLSPSEEGQGHHVLSGSCRACTRRATAPA